MTVHLDISQLVLDPRRSGIQRAERELIRHWPGPAPLVPCRFDPGTGELHELPASVLRVLCADASGGGVADDLVRLAPHVVPGRPVPRQGVRLLSAELFLDPARAGLYRRLARQGGVRVHWLVYDLLPWLHPGWFGSGSARLLMPFLRAMMDIPHLAFISGATRDEFGRFVRRGPVDGPVVPMGGDGLDLPRRPFDPAQRDFVLLGTVEPRKSAGAVMRAFQRLWADGVEARLTVVGATSPDATEELDLLRQLSREPRFRHLRDLPDAGVRQVLAQSRAMVFPSEGEGFGIPPMEALHAGIPVVVSCRLPALAGLPGLGQIRLDRVTPDSIAAAVLRLCDDGEARRLWDEAARLHVPTWAEFARSMAAWVQSGPAETGG